MKFNIKKINTGPLFYNIFIGLLLLVIIYSCDKEVSVTPPDPPPANGKLFVNSDPQGAQIYLNGKNTGDLTPHTIEWMDEGQYILKLKKKLFKDFSTTVTVKEDSTTFFSLNYHTLNGVNGKLLMSSSPLGAEIFLNGVSTGKFTKATIDSVFPGTYSVKLKLEGYWSDSISVDIKSGTTTSSIITLTDTALWVNYNKNNSGLPDNFINHIAIENGGIKWIGTGAAGLAKFDDRTWTIYNLSNSPIPAENILYIGIDGDGKKWICTNAGLAVFDDFNWTIYNSSNTALPVDNITCVTFEGNNKVWIGTYGGGLVLFDGVNWSIYNTSNSQLSSNFITSIAIDNQNNKWIGTYNQGTARFDGTNWLVYNDFTSGASKRAYRLAIDLNNIPWAAIGLQQFAPGGSAFFNGTAWETFVGLPSNNVLYVDVDAQNNKWFCNSEFGLSKYNNGNWTNFTTANSKIPNNRVFAIAFDGAGNKWLATYGGGIAKFKGE